MAVFKSELNRSTYQQMQYEILLSLDKSFRNSLKISQDLVSKMDRIQYAITSMAISSENSAKNIASITEKFTKSYESLEKTTSAYEARLKETTKSTSNLGSNMETAGRKIEEASNRINSAGQVLTSVLHTAGSVIKNYWNDQIGGLRGIGDGANSFSNASNQMIRLSGMRGELVREFRGEILSTVSRLNSSTGSAFSPTDSYSDIISISQGITSNLEAIEEMARPLLLTQKTLDVNINTVADLMNRFYTRYNFSSIHMEDALDEIKGNTAGNSANAEATLENIKSLENWIGYTAGNDNEMRNEMMKTISHYTSWLESMGIDSSPYTNYLNSIAYGDYSANPELVNILSKSGISPIQATDMARSGQFEQLTEAMIEGIYKVFDTVDESYSLGKALDNYGIDRNVAMEAWNVMRSENYVGLEDFMKNLSNDIPTMIESAEDQYVSLQDKANHWLERIYGVVAKFQEMNPLGFGVSDVALMAALLGKDKISSLGSSLMRGAKGLLGGASATAATTVATGTTTTAATVGTTAGITTAVAAAAPFVLAALAAGGVAYLGKKWYDNATALSGNAEKIEDELSKLGNNLKDENQERLHDILDLEYAFEREADVSKQRELMLESGLFTQADLNNTADEELKSLIESYRNAASSMDEVTDRVMETANKYYEKQQDEQQDQLIRGLKMGSFDETQRNDIIDIIKASGVTDEALLDKINKAQKDGKISQGEFNDIIYGGANAWFDKNNIQDQALSIVAMQRLSTYAGLGLNFESADNANEVARLWNNFLAAPTGIEQNAARKAIKESGLEDEIREVYGNLEVMGYAQGTNYIPNDQIALLHEGEAVIPKKYNPAANIEELKKMANEMQNRNDSSETRAYLESFIDEMKEIRAFLVEWKEENIRRETVSEAKSRYAYNRAAINGYNPRTT